MISFPDFYYVDFALTELLNFIRSIYNRTRLQTQLRAEKSAKPFHERKFIEMGIPEVLDQLIFMIP